MNTQILRQGGLEVLHWVSNKEFFIEETGFSIDITEGPDRRESTDEFFTLVKTRKHIEDYLCLQDEGFENVLELGMFQGGSIVFFDKLLKPKRLAGVDIKSERIGALERYIERGASHIKTHYNSSQDDEALLKNIVETDLNGSVDLIVDDASHLYELTRKSFLILFPLLEPGGLYIIEDWAWSHREGSQQPAHPRYDKPALTNLVFELIVELAGNRDIEEVSVNNTMVKIRKSSKASGGRGVLESMRLRDKKLFTV